jgi:hypothetical protein
MEAQMSGPATTLTPAPTTTALAPMPFSTGPQLAPTFDVIELLPPRAAGRLRALRQRATDAHAVSVSFEDVRTASMAKIEAANRLKRLTDHPQDGGFKLPLSDSRVIVATAHLEKMSEDFERLTELQTVRAAAFQMAAQAKVTCETYLRDGLPGGTALEAVDVKPPKPTKGETGLLDQIESRRAKVRDLRAELRRIESAPYPSAHAKAKCRAAVEALAQRCVVDVGRVVAHDGEIVWPTQVLRAQVFNSKEPIYISTEVPDTLALFAWLNREALIKRLDVEVAAIADDKAALTPEVRQQSEAKVLDDLLSVERDESALVWLAQEQGLPAEHRGDCAALAILQCRLITAPRATNATSSEHFFEVAQPR